MLFSSIHFTHSDGRDLYYQIGEYIKSITDIDKSFIIMKDDPELYFIKGLSLLKLNKIEDALSCFELSLQKGFTDKNEFLQNKVILNKIDSKKIESLVKENINDKLKFKKFGMNIDSLLIKEYLNKR